MPKITYFTSESVCAGHPDKICDAISDAILDAALTQDKNSRTGIETIAGANQVGLYGEIKTKAKLDYDPNCPRYGKRLGYIEPRMGLFISRIQL
jgi:S-adenosylmethionine synthetase